MARCTKHNKSKALIGQYRTKRKFYEYAACDNCYKTEKDVIKALTSAAYAINLRKR